ncbi:hypothetical protein ACYF6T_38120 [Streptomyces sp. 7R007]
MYSALGLFSTDDGGVAQCAFTVAAVQTNQTDPEIAAQGILATLSRDPVNDTRWMDLPCGPAASCVTLRELSINPSITADGQPKKPLTEQIEVHVPFPTGPYAAIFTLHTASTECWEEFYNHAVAAPARPQLLPTACRGGDRQGKRRTGQDRHHGGQRHPAAARIGRGLDVFKG